MRLEDLQNYITNAENLISIEPKIEGDELGHFYVTKSKEVYSYATEDEADAKINEVRQDARFVGAEKKYKKGKINKAGEIITPETFRVTVKYQD